METGPDFACGIHNGTVTLLPRSTGARPGNASQTLCHEPERGSGAGHFRQHSARPMHNDVLAVKRPVRFGLLDHCTEHPRLDRLVTGTSSDSVLPGVGFTHNSIEFEVAEQVLLRKHANLGETSFPDFLHPVRIADLASADGN